MQTIYQITFFTIIGFIIFLLGLTILVRIDEGRWTYPFQSEIEQYYKQKILNEVGEEVISMTHTCNPNNDVIFDKSGGKTENWVIWFSSKTGEHIGIPCKYLKENLRSSSKNNISTSTQISVDSPIYYKDSKGVTHKDIVYTGNMNWEKHYQNGNVVGTFYPELFINK